MRICSREQMDAHLRELEILTGRRPESQELLPSEQIERLRQRIVDTTYTPTMTYVLPFGAPELWTLAKQLREADETNVYVWTPSSTMCGLLPPVPLRSVNFGFPFEVNPEGIISLTTANLSDCLILDFSEERSGRVVEVEAMGPKWGAICLAP